MKEVLTSSYETLFIVDMSNGEAAVKALVEKFIGMITEAGTLTGVNEWGKRRLAYPINDLAEGYYVLATFNAPHDFPAELERVFNITDGILRGLVIKTENVTSEGVTYEPRLMAAPDEIVIEDEEAGNPPKAEPVVEETEEVVEETAEAAEETAEADAE